MEQLVMTVAEIWSSPFTAPNPLADQDAKLDRIDILKKELDTLDGNKAFLMDGFVSGNERMRIFIDTETFAPEQIGMDAGLLYKAMHKSLLETIECRITEIKDELDDIEKHFWEATA